MVHFANNLHQTFATFMYPLMYVNNKNIIVSTVYTTYYSSLLDLISTGLRKETLSGDIWIQWFARKKQLWP